jgi:hypothetical protein
MDPAQNEVTTYQVEDQDGQQVDSGKWASGMQLIIDGKATIPRQSAPPLLAQEEETLDPPDFDSAETAWRRAKSASTAALEGLSTPDPKFTELLAAKMQNEYGGTIADISPWMANTFGKIAQHEIFMAGHDPSDPINFDDWVKGNLPKKDTPKPKTSPYRQVLINRLPTLMRAIASPIPEVQVDGFQMASYIFKNFGDDLDPIEASKIAQAALNHLSNPWENHRIAAAASLERVAPSLPEGENSHLIKAAAVRSSITHEDTLLNIALIGVYKALTPKLPKGEPFKRPEEAGKAFREFEFIVRDTASMKVREKAQEVIFELKEAFPHLSKYNHYDRIAEMGLRYRQIAKVDPQGTNPPQGHRKDYAFLKDCLRSEDPAAQALAAISIGAMTDVCGEHTIDAAHEMNAAMRRLSVEKPSDVETSEFEYKQIPIVSPEAVYKPYEQHPAEQAAHIVDKTAYNLWRKMNKGTKASSKAYRQMALELAPLAVVEYSKLMVSTSKNNIDADRIRIEATANYEAMKSNGISPEIKDHAKRMLPHLTGVAAARMGPVGIIARTIKTLIKI